MSYVYLIGPRDWRFGWVKIGTTRSNPKARLSALQTGCPFELQIYAFFTGDTTLERVLHETFAPLRGHGEWFRMDHKLLDFVSNTFPETFGEKPIPEKLLWNMFSECIIADEPPYDLKGDESWYDSADAAPLSCWMGDIAWRDHCEAAR